jgi:hypothetical protein
MMQILFALAAATACPEPRLDFRAAAEMTLAEQSELTTRFRAATAQACVAGTFAVEPLVDARSEDKATIFISTAPEANVTAIYFAPSGAPPATMMEVPFGPDRRLPDVEELREAIHCWIVGATPEEEETSGRCLVD